MGFLVQRRYRGGGGGGSMPTNVQVTVPMNSG